MAEEDFQRAAEYATQHAKLIIAGEWRSLPPEVKVLFNKLHIASTLIGIANGAKYNATEDSLSVIFE